MDPTHRSSCFLSFSTALVETDSVLVLPILLRASLTVMEVVEVI